MRTGGVAVHLGGGFHHALPDAGGGFCVFNDVAVAIRRLRARGFVEPVLVVDLDLHDGNGTRAHLRGGPDASTRSRSTTTTGATTDARRLDGDRARRAGRGRQPTSRRCATRCRRSSSRCARGS